MKFFHDAKARERGSGGLELWCTCIACLLASGGAHDELAFKVSRELHSHGELVLDETSAQLCFHSFLRQAPPPAELFKVLESLVVDGLYTGEPTALCNAALHAIAKTGTEEEFWRIHELMRSNDILQDENTFMCGVAMCVAAKDGAKCYSLVGEMGAAAFDTAPAQPALLHLCSTCRAPALLPLLA